MLLIWTLIPAVYLIRVAKSGSKRRAQRHLGPGLPQATLAWALGPAGLDQVASAQPPRQAPAEDLNPGFSHPEPAESSRRFRYFNPAGILDFFDLYHKQRCALAPRTSRKPGVSRCRQQPWWLFAGAVSTGLWAISGPTDVRERRDDRGGFRRPGAPPAPGNSPRSRCGKLAVTAAYQTYVNIDASYGRGICGHFSQPPRAHPISMFPPRILHWLRFRHRARILSAGPYTALRPWKMPSAP